jgi:hypothetical protein
MKSADERKYEGRDGEEVEGRGGSEGKEDEEVAEK